MEQKQNINEAQYEVLNMLSCINQQEDVMELKSIIVQFLNSRLQNEIEGLWANGTLSEKKVSAWEHEHMRTAYK